MENILEHSMLSKGVEKVKVTVKKGKEIVSETLYPVKQFADFHLAVLLKRFKTPARIKSSLEYCVKNLFDFDCKVTWSDTQIIIKPVCNGKKAAEAFKSLM